MSLRLVHTLGSEDDDRVWHASWSRDGRFLATCGEDKVIRIYTTGNGDWGQGARNLHLVSTLEDGQTRTIRSCDWSPDGKCIAAASFDGTVVIWECQNRQKSSWEMIANLEGHENEVKFVSWSGDGSLLATCGRDKTVWLWEVVDDDSMEFECLSVLQGHSQDVKNICWHPYRQQLLSASYDDLVKVWAADGDDWYCADTLTAHSSTVWGLCMNTEGTRMVSCSDDKSVVLWEEVELTNKKTTWKRSAQLEALHRFPIYSVDWNPSNNYIACGSGDNAISLLLAERDGAGASTLAESSRVEGAHSADVNCVRWNPGAENSDILVSAGDDGKVKLWALCL